MLKAVFFDAAGTLFESRLPVAEIYAELARQFGVDADARQVGAAFRNAFGSAPALAFGTGHRTQELRRLEREWWRQRVAETFTQIGEFADFEAYFDRLFAIFGEPATWEPCPEAIPTLQRLKDEGLIVGVISNFDYRVHGVLGGLGMDALLDSTTISSEAGYAKPASEIFALALAKHRLKPLECVHVGDSIALDVVGAQTAGIRAILVKAGTDPDALPAVPAVRSLGQIPDLVKTLGLTF
jgi:putative hydrolase of the HAD superfamily